MRLAQDADSLVREIAQAGLAAILVLDPSTWTGAEWIAGAVAGAGCDAAYELGNELDGVADPRNYASAFARAEKAIRSVQPDATVLTAGIRSTRRECLDWLRAVVATGQISERACVGYHTYRATVPGVPTPGFATREAEFAALRDAARGRRLWMTEIGWSTAPRKASGLLGCLKSPWRYTDEQVAEMLDFEYRVNRDQGSESFVVFQLGDGPTDTNENRFGIRRMDGSLKPSATVVQRYA